METAHVVASSNRIDNDTSLNKKPKSKPKARPTHHKQAKSQHAVLRSDNKPSQDIVDLGNQTFQNTSKHGSKSSSRKKTPKPIVSAAAGGQHGKSPKIHQPQFSKVKKIPHHGESQGVVNYRPGLPDNRVPKKAKITAKNKPKLVIDHHGSIQTPYVNHQQAPKPRKPKTKKTKLAQTLSLVAADTNPKYQKNRVKLKTPRPTVVEASRAPPAEGNDAQNNPYADGQHQARHPKSKGNRVTIQKAATQAKDSPDANPNDGSNRVKRKDPKKNAGRIPDLALVSLDIPLISLVHRLRHSQDADAIGTDPITTEVNSLSDSSHTSRMNSASTTPAYSPSPLFHLQIACETRRGLLFHRVLLFKRLFESIQASNSSITHQLNASHQEYLLKYYEKIRSFHSFDILHEHISSQITSKDTMARIRHRDIFLSINDYIAQLVQTMSQGVPFDPIAIPAGSSIVGLATPASDMDFALMSRSTFEPISPSKTLQLLKEMQSESIPIFRYVAADDNDVSSSSHTDRTCYGTPLNSLDDADPMSPIYWALHRENYRRLPQQVGHTKTIKLIDSSNVNRSKKKVIKSSNVNCLKVKTMWKPNCYVDGESTRDGSNSNHAGHGPNEFSVAGPDVDITSSDQPSLSKSLLVATCGKLCPYTFPLILAVGQWASNRCLKDASIRYLNSYSLYLLVIFFLQVKGLLPVLHRFPVGGSHSTTSNHVQQVQASTGPAAPESSQPLTHMNPHSRDNHMLEGRVSSDQLIHHTSSTGSIHYGQPFLTIRPSATYAATDPSPRQFSPERHQCYEHVFDPPFIQSMEHPPFIVSHNEQFHNYIRSLLGQGTGSAEGTEGSEGTDSTQSVSPSTGPTSTPIPQKKWYTSSFLKTIIQHEHDNLYPIDWTACRHPDSTQLGLGGSNYTTYIGYNHGREYGTQKHQEKNHLYSLDELRQHIHQQYMGSTDPIQQSITPTYPDQIPPAAESQRPHVDSANPQITGHPPDTVTKVSEDGQPFSYSTLYALLYEFFHYYAYVVDFRYMVPSIRLGHLAFREYYSSEQQYLLIIEDPFNPNDNPCRSLDNDTCSVFIYELRRAAYLFHLHASWWAISLPYLAELTAARIVMRDKIRLPHFTKSYCADLRAQTNTYICGVIQNILQNAIPAVDHATTSTSTPLEQLLDQAHPSFFELFKKTRPWTTNKALPKLLYQGY